MLGDAIYTLGSQHAGLVALIGDNLFPVAEQREHQARRVVFEIGEQEPVAGIYQDSGWFHSPVTFSCYGETARDAGLVAAQVRACFQRYHSAGVAIAGHAIDDVKAAAGSGAQHFEPELEQYVEEVVLEFFHN